MIFNIEVPGLSMGINENVMRAMQKASFLSMEADATQTQISMFTQIQLCVKDHHA